MKFCKKIFSTLLAVMMLLSVVSTFGISVSAADKEEELTADQIIQNQYLGVIYNTPEEKLATMTMMLERDGYQLWVDATSGEVATVETASGNIAFSNPYDVAGPLLDPKLNGSDSTKKQVLSQLIVQYIDNGTTKYLYSFEEAAMREQINVLSIKNGVRIEYTIGREESRKLVPRLISVDNYKELLDGPLQTAVANEEISKFFYDKFNAFYDFTSLEECRSQKAKDNLLITYPICAEMDIYVFATDASAVELNWVESIIKAYCEDYTFEQMDADHEETGYEATDEKYPVFKMALEYSLDKNGMNVRMPCNGLRYDMSTYTLENLTILPYFGAGNSENPGYNFYPDGSGSLFDFEQLNTKSTTTIRGKVYGIDYAYHTINGTYQKAIRYPVYGTVATETIYSFTCANAAGETENVRVSNSIMDLEEIQTWLETNGMTITSEISEETYKRGYVAMIESGESLSEIATYHAGSLSSYNTMMNYFNPKPKDSYDISDAISVSNSGSIWTVVSERKYTGNIKIHYSLLSDVAIGEATRAENKSYKYYEASWLGMAEAYRDYLVSNGTLTKLTEDDVQEGIPLYIESFGALLTQQTIATIPVDVMTPLTTFENVLTMYNELADKGVKNINFKLTGYANGGMYYTVPSDLKWEKAVGGKNGFKELIAESEAINAKGDGSHLGLFPDFDFAYIQNNTLFDSLNLQDDAVKTIDNRYTSFRQYSATQQTYVSFYQLAVSPARYSKFYNKLIEKYSAYGLKTMSIASLGTALNSDFDEDEPYNREDNKEFTVQAFSDLKNAGYSLMTDGGNAYTWGYVDHIINVDLDSSRYIKSSASVPFIGAVLHGYIEFAGTPFNEEGDTDYAILRAIENGAGMYFILSYQNTNELKEDFFLSQYYSVRYDIWQEDVVNYYNMLNEALKDVQTKVIIGHGFLEGERVLDKDELLAEIEQSLKDAAEAEKQKQEDLKNAQIVQVADAWNSAENARTNILALIQAMNDKNAELLKNYNLVVSFASNGAKDAIVTQMLKMGEDEETNAKAIANMQAYIDSIKTTAANVLKCYEEQKLLLQSVYQVIEDVEAASDIIMNSELSDEVKTNMVTYIAQCLTDAQTLIGDAEALVDVHLDLVKDDTSDKSVTRIATTCRDTVQAYKTVMEDYIPHVEALKAACESHYFTVEDVRAAVKLDDDSIGDDNDDTTAGFDKYHVDNNKIVVVTYGDRDDITGVKTAYKSFILNYNTFAVVVEYDDVKYTIPSGGYVVLYEN